MRLDKFLKISRLIKRRTVAKDVSEQGRVWVNGKEAKPANQIKVGDEITIRYGQKSITVRVEQLLDTTRKEDSETMYSVIHEQPLVNSPTSTEQ
jgi:ribosomal 50S subunit-recycling heat shock protein